MCVCARVHACVLICQIVVFISLMLIFLRIDIIIERPLPLVILFVKKIPRFQDDSRDMNNIICPKNQQISAVVKFRLV